MATIEEIRELKRQGKNREIIAAVESESRPDDEKLLERAWAHHQLGEYGSSIPIMLDLTEEYPIYHEIGESALQGYAHGILQRDGDIETADRVMRKIPESLGLDNVRMNMMIMAVRKGLEIPATNVMDMITNALRVVPYATINGHIINNGVLVLHEAREQKDIQPCLPILPGLIEIAIGIYAETGTAKNHLAGACYRGSLVFEAAGPSWHKGAEELAQDSADLWRELVSSQDGTRFQKNLDGALAQLKKLEEKGK